MKFLKSLLILTLLIMWSLAYSQQRKQEKIYDARTAEYSILTPPASPAPRINVPGVYGARPNKQFIYRIPCEGQRPISFTISGLPSGMLLDADKGIITGVTPAEKGTFNLVITAKNSKGVDTKNFKLIVGDKIALTPPMGWNSWGGHMRFISDEVMRKATDVIVETGLADVGFQYVSIDDCWQMIPPEYYNVKENRTYLETKTPGFDFEPFVGPTRDEYGNILTNYLFPDMKGLTSYIHSFGLKAGIYSSPASLTCQRFEGSYGYEKIDAKRFSDWGFDLLKHDMCTYRPIMRKLNAIFPEGTPEISEVTLWYPMSDFLLQQDRDILYNVCQYGRQDPWLWVPQIGGHSWRIGGDLNHDVTNYFRDAMKVVKELRDYSKPGQWNDPDFLYLGKILTEQDGENVPMDIPLSTNQKYQYVSLWSMICAPYFFSTNMDEIDDFTIGLLRNADIVAVNQDELGLVASILRETDKYLILTKELADGGIVVGIFNTDADNEQVINVQWSDVGFCDTRSVRDLWRQKELGKIKDEIKVKVSANGCAILKVY